MAPVPVVREREEVDEFWPIMMVLTPVPPVPILMALFPVAPVPAMLIVLPPVPLPILIAVARFPLPKFKVRVPDVAAPLRILTVELFAEAPFAMFMI
jgi:hypothetical protein